MSESCYPVPKPCFLMVPRLSGALVLGAGPCVAKKPPPIPANAACHAAAQGDVSALTGMDFKALATARADFDMLKHVCMGRTWQLLMRLATPRTLAISSSQGCWSKAWLLDITEPRLIWAADSGNVGAVELLLSVGVDDTAKGSTVETLPFRRLVSTCSVKARFVAGSRWHVWGPHPIASSFQKNPIRCGSLKRRGV